jgi:hypothetical protein
VEQRAQQQEDRLFEEPEPAPVDRIAELGDALGLILVEDGVFLGTGDQARGGAGSRARRDGLRGIDQIGAEQVVAQRAEVAGGALALVGASTLIQ